jgi:hypothetical protein
MNKINHKWEFGVEMELCEFCNKDLGRTLSDALDFKQQKCELLQP